MTYTMKQVSEKTHLTPHTLRFYEKEGLLPFVGRTSSGIRRYSDSDLEWLSVICCLKGTGMSVKQIHEYIELCIQGDDTLEQRRQIFINQRQCVLQQIEDLKKHLEKVDYKIAIYDQAIEELKTGKKRTAGCAAGSNG